MKSITTQVVRNTSATRNTSKKTCTCTTCQVCDTCNAIHKARYSLFFQGYHAMISPTGNTLTYQNLNNPAFQCTDGSLMLSIFENALGFPIELEDPDADHYLKTQLPVFAKNGAGRLQPVVSWLAHAPSESFLFAHNEDVYEALTGLKHINFYKSTVPVTSPNAFSNACKVMSEKGVAISGVSEAIFELIHQKYITFPNKMEQFQQHLNSVEA